MTGVGAGDGDGDVTGAEFGTVTGVEFSDFGVTGTSNTGGVNGLTVFDVGVVAVSRKVDVVDEVGFHIIKASKAITNTMAPIVIAKPPPSRVFGMPLSMSRPRGISVMCHLFV